MTWGCRHCILQWPVLSFCRRPLTSSKYESQEEATQLTNKSCTMNPLRVIPRQHKVAKNKRAIAYFIIRNMVYAENIRGFAFIFGSQCIFDTLFIYTPASGVLQTIRLNYPILCCLVAPQSVTRLEMPITLLFWQQLLRHTPNRLVSGSRNASTSARGVPVYIILIASSSTSLH